MKPGTGIPSEDDSFRLLAREIALPGSPGSGGSGRSTNAPQWPELSPGADGTMQVSLKMLILNLTSEKLLFD